ncbi:MAG: peptidoglycan DD-metalloendopeptidase family protein [Acutalibacteraceae bacterium]
MDSVQYAIFCAAEAEEIIIPSEYGAEEQKNPPTEESTEEKASPFSSLLDFIENTGEFTLSLFQKGFGWLPPLLTLFISKTGRILKQGRERLSRKGKPSKGDFFRQIFEDIRTINLQSKKEHEDEKRHFRRELIRYLHSRLPERKKAAEAALSFLFPLAAMLAVILCVKLSSGSVTAVEVICAGKTVGYVSDTETYSLAVTGARQLLGEGADLLSEPVFRLKRVKINELSNSEMISEALIKASDESYIRACGIYLDGNFLCAVKNETDAAAVFAGILEAYEKKQDSDDIVDFVEEISYVHGYYPQSSQDILDSGQLKKLLTSDASPVRIKVMKTRVRTETIPYKTVKKKDSTLYKGTKKTAQQGKNGRAVITELVTYIDSKKTYTSLLSEKVTAPAQDEILLIGTKTSSYSTDPYSSSPYRQFIWPTRGAYAISSGYGYRSASISGRSYHGGLDIVLGTGSSAGIPVVASASGTVTVAYSGWSGYGHTVVIDHGNGICTRYAHMMPGSLRVRVGDRVYQGQQIGKIGSTGNSTGPHLHFEILVNGRKTNPLPYIR